jgi:hypothetical protein
VVIEIDDRPRFPIPPAARTGARRWAFRLFGIPQRLDDAGMPEGASMAEAVESSRIPPSRATAMCRARKS